MKNKLILVSIICIIGSTLGFINSSATTDRPTTSGPISSESKLPSTGPSGLPTNTPTPPLTYENYTYTVSNDTVTITGCDTSVSGTITIPSTINDYPVTTIGGSAFFNCINLTGIIIPDSVTSIRTFAFSGCSNLTSITLPDNLTSVGFEAFSETGYFNDISNWVDDVLYIGKHLISAKKSIGGIYRIKDGTKHIVDSAFFWCENLTSIIIPNSVTNISSLAFFGCSNLTSITIPDSVTSIGSSAFSQCSNLISITIPYGITTIENDTFSYCTKLSSIIIPDSVTSIGKSAFSACDNLKNIAIPNSVTTIGDDAFHSCRNLTTIAFPDSVTSIGADAFSETAYFNDDSNWVDNVLYMGNHLVSAKKSISGICRIKDGTEYIVASAFSDCTNLTGITIPNSVITIGNNAFYRCSNLNGVYITNIESWCKITFALPSANPLNYGGNLYLNGTLVTNLTIPDSVSQIKYAAFYGCTSLTSVAMSDNVTTIRTYAFSNCSNLTTITIPNNATNIGSYIFSNCISLTNIIVPDTMTSIGSRTFEGCTGLTTITIPHSIKSIGYSAFYNCPNLKTVYYKGTAEEWNEIYVNSENTNLTNATIVYVKCTQTAVSDDGKTFTVKGINLNIDDTVILALYNGDQFVEMQDAVYSGHDIPFTTDKSYTSAKVFVWDTLYSLEPITKVEIVKQ